MKWVSCVILVLFYIVHLLSASTEQERYWYPEYKERAEKARNVWRERLVHSTLKDAAGIYHNKTKGREKGHEKTVFTTVVSYNEKLYYKLYFHNLLCYMREHDIDIVVYFLHYNMNNSDSEIKTLTDMGIKILPYPEELFWTLMYSKSNEIRTGPNRVDFQSDVPSFKSHGALVMLVPVLEVLLLGYNAIFFDIDIALMVDPVPFLTRGSSDFVFSVEMRACPDFYTPTYLNASELHAKPPIKPRFNSMEETNWHSLEPNTGTMLVRSTEAAIGFYTEWLLRIVKVNEGNDQKVMRRDPETAHYSRDCLYGENSDEIESMKYHFRRNKYNSGHPPPEQTARRALRSKRKPKLEVPILPSLPSQLGQPPPLSPPKQSAHAGHVHSGHHAPRHQRNIVALRARWASNYTTLVEDVIRGDFQKPIKFCFLSELLFQNGQTAFNCAVKPMFKDSYNLEIYKKGLKSPYETGSTNMILQEDIANSTSNARFPVTVHANFCDKKTHELSVRGLWLVQTDSTDAPFNATTCRAYDPWQTHAGRFNWSDEVAQIKHNRQYMVETFVVPGGLIQSVNGMEVYYVNEHKQKQLFPDGDTFVAKMGHDKWGAVRYLPQVLMDAVPTGPPFPSVKELVQPPAPEAPATPAVTATGTVSTSNATTPLVAVSILDQAAVNVTPPSVFPPARVVRVDGKHFFDAPPVAADVPVVHKAQEHLHKQIVPGMLVRTPDSQMVYYIDRHLFRRKVPSMQVFHRLFGTRHYDIVTLPEKAVSKLRAGEPLL